jgi:hypothetical protein
MDINTSMPNFHQSVLVRWEALSTRLPDNVSLCFIPSSTRQLDGLIGFVRVMAKVAFVLVQPIIQGPCWPHSSIESTRLTIVTRPLDSTIE